jgi:hypothetical protein
MRMVNEQLTASKDVFSVAGEPSAVEPASISAMGLGVFPRRAASSRLQPVHAICIRDTSRRVLPRSKRLQAGYRLLPHDYRPSCLHRSAATTLTADQ